MVTFQQFADFTGEEITINYYTPDTGSRHARFEAFAGDEDVIDVCSTDCILEDGETFTPVKFGPIQHTVEEWVRFLGMDITVTPEKKTVEYYVFTDRYQICITAWIKK